MAEQFEDMNRYFLFFLLQELLKTYLTLSSFVELSYVHSELRSCRDQYDGQVCYGVVNNVSDEQSNLGTKDSVPQIAFFKGIVCHACSYFCTLLIKFRYLLYKDFRLESKCLIHMCDESYQYLDLSQTTSFITLSAFSFPILAICSFR